MKLWKNVKKRKKEGMMIQIDFEKAYDHLDWNFLNFVLEAEGFGVKWTSWKRVVFNL